MADGSTKSRSIGTNTDNDGGHKETQLDPIRTAWQIHRGPPSYTHAVLPWVWEFKFDPTSTADRWYTWDFGFRMTSIYDPFINSTNFDIQSGSGVANAISLRPESTDPHDTNSYGVGFADFYRSMYKYYSVLGCRYKVTVENLSPNKMYAYKMFCNDTNPPAEASNWDMRLWDAIEDTQLIQPYAKWMSPNADTGKVQHLESAGIMIDDDISPALGTNTASAYINNPTGNKFAYFVGEYRPGSHQHEIHQDTDVEIWTPVAQNPKLREALLIRLKPYDSASVSNGDGTFSVGQALSFNITVECEYLVEFKELQPYIRWPVNRNPVTVNINTNPR